MELAVGAKGTLTLAMVVIDRWVVSTVAVGGVLVSGTTTFAVLGTVVPWTAKGGSGTAAGTACKWTATAM